MPNANSTVTATVDCSEFAAISEAYFAELDAAEAADREAAQIVGLRSDDSDVLDHAKPASWDGVRDFEVAALHRMALASGAAELAYFCEHARVNGGQAPDSLKVIAAAINERLDGASTVSAATWVGRRIA